MDRQYITEMRRQRDWGINPWATHTRFILSQALVRDEAYAGPLRDWLGDEGKQALLILDEAHNAASASGSKFAIDSKLTRAIRDLAGRFEHKLFLSATPHNGHSNSFSALLEILDPTRFCRGAAVRKGDLGGVKREIAAGGLHWRTVATRSLRPLGAIPMMKPTTVPHPPMDPTEDLNKPWRFWVWKHCRVIRPSSRAW
jgi:hypothetical protein